MENKRVLNDDFSTLSTYAVKIEDSCFESIKEKYGDMLTIESMLNIITELNDNVEHLEEKCKNLKEKVNAFVDNVNPYSYYGVSEEEFH